MGCGGADCDGGVGERGAFDHHDYVDDVDDSAGDDCCHGDENGSDDDVDERSFDATFFGD